MKKFLMYIIPVVCAVLGIYLFVVYYNMGKEHRKELICTGIDVVVTDSLENQFVLADDVKGFLADEYGEYLGVAIDSINLDAIENLLKSKSAIRETEAYISKNGIMKIEVNQRKPIVRFIGQDSGYYADKDGRAFPLQSTYASYVKTVDGDIPAMTDSAKILKIVRLVNFIEDSSEWKDKIVNISIDTTGNLTLIPRKGNEKFLFGPPQDIEAKMERMKLYYTSIIPATDSSRYTTINVKYSGQIICK